MPESQWIEQIATQLRSRREPDVAASSATAPES
jgi:hypothetical protein